MSNRDSLGFGDLLPQDVVDIFAQEKLNKKGRKQRSRSLGRALGWLKGKKNKNVGHKGQNPGLGPAFDLALDIHPAGYQGAPKGAQKSGKQGYQQSNSHAVPKRDDNDEETPVPLVLQENVFIEVNRPKYLEDLHSEALEGLKLMQQEERIIGPEYQDNESTISTVSARAEVDRGGFTTDSTLPDTSSTVSVQSSLSSRSSRSGLTRQGSTFRPLNSGKKSEKGRTRRRHRKTIGGIPQHLQREFGLDQVELTASPQLEEEFVNGDSDVPQLAVHSLPEANSIEAVHPLNSVQEEQLSVSQTVHVDDMALLQRLTSAQSGGDRPWSLAVPGMTTAGSGQPGPPSPVMSMSPQAAYLSKIIPNAVLPPSIEVVEISRGNSRNSLRTVSKSSLMLSSPSSSRASSRASTARSISSRSSTITSASRQNHFHLSDSSCWSNSDSDTLVSDSSTISSSSTPHQRETQDKAVSKKQNKVSVHTDSPKYPSNGKIIKGIESKKDGPFVRSLSVMKSKRAPPPPSRSYSLHNKMKRRSRDLVDLKIITPQTSDGNMKKNIDSPGYNADTSSLDEYTGSKTPSPPRAQQDVDSTQKQISTDVSNANKAALQVNSSTKVISPSSGYSSQDATSPKNPSPKHKKGLLAKLTKLFPASTTADLSTSAVTLPEVGKTSSAPVSTVSDKPSVKTLRELFTIPPHPKVQAPPPPPPEVWSHSPRSIELLLGPPAPGNTYAIVKKNPKDKRPYRQSASTSTEGTMRSEEQKQNNSIKVESKKVHESQEGSLNVHRINDSERLIQKSVKDVKEHGNVQVSEKLNSMLVRTVEGVTDRLPAIEEENKIHPQNTKNPSISPAHISPHLPTTKSVQPIVSLRHVASPESSWPPPPPPVSQAGLGSPEETEFPLPPPPIIIETEIVLPVQVPPDKSVSTPSNVSTSLQGNTAPPLNIPPPPNYTAPPPPIKTNALSEKVKLFSHQSKDAPPPPSKITLSPSKEVVESVKICKPSPQAPSPKEISQTVSSINDSTLATTIISPVPPPPNPPPPPPPPQKLRLDIIPSKNSHAPNTKPPLLRSNAEDLPPPDIIPPTPSKEVVVVPNLVANVPTASSFQVFPLAHKEVLPPTEILTSEPTEASLPQPVVQNMNYPPVSEINTEVVISPIPPSPPKEPGPPSEDVSPPDQLEISPSKASPPPIEVSAQLTAEKPPVEVTVIPPEVPKPPSEDVSTVPEAEDIPSPEKVSSPPAVSITQPEDVSLLPVDELSRPQEVPSPPTPQIEAITLKSQIEEHSEAPLPPEEISIPSPKDGCLPNDVASPSPPLEAAAAPSEDIPPSPKEALSPDIEVSEAAEPQGTEDLPPSVVEERFLPVVVEVSYPQLSLETSTDEVEEALEDSQKSAEIEMSPTEETQVISLSDSDSGLKSESVLQTEIKLSEEEILNEIDSGLPPWKGILSPPQSIPPPPPLPINEQNKQEESPSEPEPHNLVPTSEPDVSPSTEFTSQQEITTATLAPCPTEEISKEEPVTDSAELQTGELDHTQTVVEVSENANSTNDQAINGSSESPKTEDEAKLKDKEEMSSQAQTSATTEVPQKPIRRSLVMSSPASPPATATTSPIPLKDPSPNTVPTTTITKSPPAMAPSMNLQEAIRLRTAARSQNGPSRLGIHSPPGFDVRKSPTSTASFIFSKSSKKVVIETRPEVKVEKKTEVPARNISVEQSKRKEFKVPPPVAKKPKPKTKEVETDDTAGQDTHSETIKDNAQKPNGTARTVEEH